MTKEEHNTDLHLVEQVKKGDTKAFRILVEKYKNVSFSLACSILKNECNAEDALQEAFLKVFKNIKKFRNNASFSTWLYRIVVNTSYTALKKQSKEYLLNDKNEQKALSIAEETKSSEYLIQNNRKEIINKALNNLKPDESLLLRLYYLSDLDINEIKKVTGFGESKIKVTLHRARKSLHEYLEKVLGNELKQLL